MTYLTIITTVLVLTQIIRVTQNAIQLRKYAESNKQNEEVLRIWKSIAKRFESEE
jgi:hypothetical protein